MKKNKSKIKELELKKICGEYFLQKGFLIREEVPFLLKVADLLCLHEDSGECIAIEVKVKDWRKALKQAIVYQMMADRVYIAMSNRHIKSIDHDLLAENAVGLISVDLNGTVCLISEAAPSPRRLPYFTSQAIATAFPGRSSLSCLMM
jgi:hypothetical protein